MSDRAERIRIIVERIGMHLGERLSYPGEPVKSALSAFDIAQATDALLSAAVVRPDEGETRELPPIPTRGAHISVLFRIPKEEGRHSQVDAVLIEHGMTGLFWVPVDDDTGVIFTPWRDVEQYEGPKP